MLNKKLILYSVCLMLFIDGISGGLIFPILPELFMNSKSGLVVSNKYLSIEILYSLSLALFPLSSMFGMPILGTLSDRYGRNKIILYGMAGLTFNYLLSIISILTHNIWLFLLSILLSGFLSGTYSVGNALISDISDNDQERISNFKLPTFASTLGFILGPGLSIFIDKTNLSNPLVIPYIIACILSIINFFLLWNNLNKAGVKYINYVPNQAFVDNIDILANKHSIHLLLLVRSIFISLIYVFSNSYIKMLALTYLLFQFGFGLFLQSLSLHLASNHHYTPSQISNFFVIMFIAMAVSMYLLQKLVTRYVNYKIQVKLGLIIISTLLIVGLIFDIIVLDIFQLYYAYITWMITIMFYIIVPFITLGFTNLFANSVYKKDQGKIMGVNGQIYSIGFFLSALFVGKLMVISYNLVLLISGISFMLSYVILKKLVDKECFFQN